MENESFESNRKSFLWYILSFEFCSFLFLLFIVFVKGTIVAINSGWGVIDAIIWGGGGFVLFPCLIVSGMCVFNALMPRIISAISFVIFLPFVFIFTLCFVLPVAGNLGKPTFESMEKYQQLEEMVMDAERSFAAYKIDPSSLDGKWVKGWEQNNNFVPFEEHIKDLKNRAIIEREKYHNNVKNMPWLVRIFY